MCPIMRHSEDMCEHQDDVPSMFVQVLHHKKAIPSNCSIAAKLQLQLIISDNDVKLLVYETRFSIVKENKMFTGG